MDVFRNAHSEEDLVRCLACGSVYALPVRAPADEGGHGCPQCLSLSWIAVAIPPRQASTVPGLLEVPPPLVPPA